MVICQCAISAVVFSFQELLTDSDIASKKSKTPNRELQVCHVIVM